MLRYTGLQSQDTIKEASFYEKEKDGVRCLLCPHRCFIPEGKEGICKARFNKGGVLYTKIYGAVSSIAMDPIEKKPLYHFHPGSGILSIGTIFCNFSCRFCQNWQLVEAKVDVEYISPEQIVELALRHKSIGIAYTYSEPIIWYEYVRDTAILAKERGLKNVLVTNGFIEEEPLKELLPYIDAMNIDLKYFDDQTYRRLSGGRLKPVLKTIEIASQQTHIEVTNLVITGVNDQQEMFAKLVDWLSNISRDIPLHLSRYFPMYKFSNPPTPFDTLRRFYEIASKKLNYVYVGNILWEEGESTYCKGCKKPIIVRDGYFIKEYHLKGDRCEFCNAQNNIVV